jgi:hypothetical protein
VLLVLIRSPGIARFFSRIFGVPEFANRSTSNRPPNPSIEPDVSFKQLVQVVVEPGVASDLVEQLEHHTGDELVDLLD